MQLNVYVPESRGHVLRMLEAASERTGRPKNDLVLDAVERYLSSAEGGLEPGRYELGEVRLGRRGDLYDGRLCSE